MQVCGDRIQSVSAYELLLLLLLQGAELPLMVERFGLLKDIFTFPSTLDADYPVFNLHLANILFDDVIPSILGFCLQTFTINLHEIYQCRMYSTVLLMMGREYDRNM
jgi:hypothetical protein